MESECEICHAAAETTELPLRTFGDACTTRVCQRCFDAIQSFAVAMRRTGAVANARGQLLTRAERKGSASTAPELTGAEGARVGARPDNVDGALPARDNVPVPMERTTTRDVRNVGARRAT